MKIITLATSHNRKTTTLRALSDLHNSNLPEEVKLEHLIVDDGSSDGTSEAIRQYYPNVEIIQGNGELYWAGGMRYAWENSIRHKDFDYLFAYNDDIRLFSDGLARLIHTGRQLHQEGMAQAHIIVGAFKEPDQNATAYSGYIHDSVWHKLRLKRVDPLFDGYQVVHTCNMNGCLIHAHAIDKVGFFSPAFSHGYADFDFGLRLNRAGGRVVLAPKFIGTCSRNQEKDNFVSLAHSLGQCYKILLSRRYEPIWERYLFCKKHGGIIWPALWLAPYFLLPLKFLTRHKQT